jgi:hypothetical protein
MRHREEDLVAHHHKCQEDHAQDDRRDVRGSQLQPTERDRGVLHRQKSFANLATSEALGE